MATSYVTTRGRRLISIVLGTAIGGAVTTIPVLLLTNGDGDASSGRVIASVVASFLGWLLGLVILGLPGWLIAERRWGPSRRTAVLCGLTFAPAWWLVLAFSMELSTLKPGEAIKWTTTLAVIAVGSVPLAALGCGVAYAMWRYAYRDQIGPTVEVFS